MKGESVNNPESITINGLRAATASFAGTVKGRAVTIRVVAMEWKPGQFFRFQMAIPTGADQAAVEGLKRTTYSFRRLSESEKKSIKPARIKIVTARSGDTVASLAAKLPFPSHREERFRMLNGLRASDGLKAGQAYKIVVE